MSVSLKDKTIKAVGWSAIDNVSYISVTFIIGIVLARLLSPDDFGLIGIIAIFTAISNTLINGGLSSALVRKNIVSEDDYNTAFIINFGISITLYLIIFVCSPLISTFFSREELSLLIRVSSLELIFGALGLVQKAQLTKRIDFKSFTKITLCSTLISGVVGIILAILGFGVWALVVQVLVKTGLQSITLWIINKWVPRFYLSKQSFNELFGYGWKVMLNDFFNSLWSELFQTVIGKCYSSATLGQFTRSKQFSFIFSSNLTNVVQRVSFPVLSSIQNDKSRMVAAYRKIIRTTMFVTSICMLFIAAISEPLVYCLIGPKWHEASVYLPLLCLSGSTNPLQAMNQNMLQVQGRSDILLSLGIVQKIIGIFPLLVGVFVGIIPMLITNIIGWAIMFLFNSYYSGRLIGYSTWRQLKDVAPSYAIASVVSISVYFLKYLSYSNWIILFLQICLGSLVFFFICEFWDIPEYKYIKTILIRYFIKP